MSKKEQLMKEAENWCDENDKSTEFMIQYMQDISGASHDEVMDYLFKDSDQYLPN